MTSSALKLPIIDLNPEMESFARAAIDGLRKTQKSIPPKFLYDQKGSELFERICEIPEYYVTRTETGILRQNAHEIGQEIGRHALVFEFGSGASVKTRILLNELPNPAGYVPIDISRDFLLESSASLHKEFPNLRLVPVCADFTRPIQMTGSPHLPAYCRRRVGFFPGSTIGNFTREEASEFLRQTARFLDRDGMLLVGVDLIKDRSVLEPAYNDHEGVTAAFNLNLLDRMRRELGATVDPSGFEHRAYFNSQEGRIEMHLVSKRPQQFDLLGHTIRFKQGESIHTECSYKYEPAQFEQMAKQAGFTTLRSWNDSRSYFAVYLLRVGT